MEAPKFSENEIVKLKAQPMHEICGPCTIQKIKTKYSYVIRDSSGKTMIAGEDQLECMYVPAADTTQTS